MQKNHIKFVLTTGQVFLSTIDDVNYERLKVNERFVPVEDLNGQMYLDIDKIIAFQMANEDEIKEINEKKPPQP